MINLISLTFQILKITIIISEIITKKLKNKKTNRNVFIVFNVYLIIT